MQLEHRADADGVAHVALGIVDHHGAGLLDDLHLSGVHMDAVAQNGLGTQDAVVLQALDRAAAIVLQAVVHVVHALGHMDVIAGAAVVGGHHAVEGLVADGEQGVSAEHGGQHGILVLLALGDEVGVFLDGLQALLLAVPVGDLIAQAGADAELLGGLGNGVQGAGDLGIGGVVIEDGGNALLDAVHIQGVGAGAGAGQGQLAVDGPPGAVQDLVEIGGIVAHDGQAPCQGGVDMGVGIDEGGHDDAALGVDEVGLGVFGPQDVLLAYLGDDGSLIGHGPVLIIALAALVPGDESSVDDQIHVCSSLQIVFLFFRVKKNVSNLRMEI